MYNNFTTPVAVLDCETTNADPTTARIVEICVTRINPDGTSKTVTERINPEQHIPEAATLIHGISDADVRNKPKFRQFAKSILEFLDGVTVLIAYNGHHFDFPLLVHEFARCEIDWDYKKYLLIDPCTIYKRKDSRTLENAIRKFLGREHENAHGAQADVDGTMDLLPAMMEAYPDLKDMSPEELALFCNYDKPVLDLFGKFKRNDEGKIVFAFGQHRDKLAWKERHYLEWMISDKSSFPKPVKDMARQILFGKLV